MRTFLRSTVALLVLGCVWPLGVSAQDGLEPQVEDSDTNVDADEDEAGEADEDAEDPSYSTVVVGSRFDTDRFLLPRSVDVAEADELVERAGTSVGDLIDEEPGVHTQTTNRGAGAPIIRGQIGPGNLIVFDGIRFNNGTFRTGPNQYLNLFDPFALERVEVLRGSGSALYGSDAIGGVLHLVPKSLSYGAGWSGGGLARFQSIDTSVVVAPEVAWSNQRWSLLLGGSLGFFGDLHVGGGDAVPASDYRQRGLHLRLGFLPHPTTEVSISAFGLQILEAGRVDRLDRSNFRRYDNDNLMTYLRVSHFGEGAFEEVRATVSLNYLREVVTRNDCVTGDVYGIRDDESPSATIDTTLDPAGCLSGAYDAIRRVRDNSDDVIVVGTSLAVRSDLPPVGLSLRWGLDAYLSFVGSSRTDFDKPDQVDPTNPEALTESERDRGDFSDNSSYDQFGAFVQAQYEVPLGAVWSFLPTLSGRVDHIRAAAPDVPGLGDIEYNDTGFAGDARLGFSNNETVSLYTGWSQGFRAPNLQETTVLADTGTFFEVPNEDLGPEQSNEIEVGARLHLAPFTIELAGFYNRITDIITRSDATFDGQSEVDGAAVKKRVNEDDATYVGVEGALRLALPYGVSVRGNVTWTKGDVSTSDGSEPARRVPPLRWHAGLRWDAPDFPIFLDLLANGAANQDRLSPGDRDDLRICGSQTFPGLLLSELGEVCGGTEGWIDLSFRAGFTFDDHTTARLFLSNLLDHRYRAHGSGTDAPGFSGGVSLESRF